MKESKIYVPLHYFSFPFRVRCGKDEEIITSINYCTRERINKKKVYVLFSGYLFDVYTKNMNYI